MVHLLFLWHAVALLSGVAFFGTLWGNIDTRQTKGFAVFGLVYLLLSGFLCFATLVLYVQINIPDVILWHRIFISAIPLFIACLNLLIPLHRSQVSELPLSFTQKMFAVLQLILAGGLAVVPWLTAQNSLNVAMSISILSLVITLLLCGKSMQTQGSSKLSLLMCSQSISLPVFEALFWPLMLQTSGLTFSLPLVYLLNNFLLWRYRQQVFVSLVNVPRGLQELSDKEQQIALAVAEGLSNKQVAARLHISPSTVKNHLYTIFKKLEITNRTALVAIMQHRSAPSQVQGSLAEK